MDSRVERYNVRIEGDVSGQIAIGENILQIGDVNGGVVNIIQPGKKPTFRARQWPVMVRPRRLPGFLDRELEMDTLVHALNDGEPVSLFAENGMGKTALLRRLAYHAPGDNFPDGMLYMPAHLNSMDDLLQIIFEHFYESDSLSKPTDAELRRLLQDVEALILLDDSQLSKEDVTQLINVVPGSVFVLASSDRCLWGEGCCLELTGLPLQDALSLIESELKRKLTPLERPFAETLHQLAAGQPLFLLQAAALVADGKSFDEIAAAVTPSTGGLGQILAEKLSATQGRILRLLETFKEISIPKKHLEALAETQNIDSKLKPLKKLHLVQEYGSAVSLAAPLTISPGMLEHVDWEMRCLEYFIRWLQGVPSLSEVREVLDLLLSLLRRAAVSGRWEAVLELGRGIERTLILSGLWGSWLQVLQWILEGARALNNPAVQAWALHQLGARSLCLGELAVAQAFLAQALGIRETLGHQAASALTRHALGVTAAPPPVPAGLALSHSAVAPLATLSIVVKAALVLGGLVATATAVVRWNPASRILSAPPSAVSPAGVDELPVTEKEPAVVAVLISTETAAWTEIPVSTATPLPSATAALIVVPASVKCAYDVDFVVARQLENEVSVSFDLPFDLSSGNMDSNRNIDLGDTLTVQVNEAEVSEYRTGLYDASRPDRLFVMLPVFRQSDTIQIQLRGDLVLTCSQVVRVDWVDMYIKPTKLPELGPDCVVQSCPSEYCWDSSSCSCYYVGTAAGCP